MNDDINWKHPKLQALLGSKARLNIMLQMCEEVMDPDYEGHWPDGEYWSDIHDKIRKIVLENIELKEKISKLTNNENNHVCGLQGFGRGNNGMNDICPGCK